MPRWLMVYMWIMFGGGLFILGVDIYRQEWLYAANMGWWLAVMLGWLIWIPVNERRIANVKGLIEENYSRDTSHKGREVS